MFGSRGDGWYVGQAYYPLLVEPSSVLTAMSEIVIYHSYNCPPHGEALINSLRVESALAKFLFKVSLILASVGLVVLTVSAWPTVSFLTKSGKEAFETKVLTQKVGNFESPSGPVIDPESIYQPRLDLTLPTKSLIKIPSIGIETALNEATYLNYEEALKKGVWRVSDFGSPYDRTKTTILAAHRYGYLAWSNIFRRKNSFYNLPKLKVGDTIEIDWKQRKYIYEVYGESEGEEINDYTANLILYTCKSLESPVRIFKYARLLEI